jgi:hypothetical protein
LRVDDDALDLAVDHLAIGMIVVTFSRRATPPASSLRR